MMLPAPSFTTGFKSSREIPIVWKIAKGQSLINLYSANNFSMFCSWLKSVIIIGGLFLAYEAIVKARDVEFYQSTRR